MPVDLVSGSTPRCGRGQRRRRVSLVDGKPAFALYVCDPSVGHFHSMGLLVVSLAGQRISAITRLDNSVLPHFGLPRELSA